MCGIVGYIGEQDATPIIMSGLKRLEYRGYDSAGIAILERIPANGTPDSDKAFTLVVRKKVGKVTELEEMVRTHPHQGNIGIGHTRWATHGAPSDLNSHPHSDQSGNIALIHNGIIENYNVIKRRLIELGHTFKSETDTEVLAHLVGEFYKDGRSLTEAVRLALNEVVGAYGVCVLSKDSPNEIICARKGSPIVIGVGDNNEYFIASDAAAIVSHTRNVIYLSDGELATVSRNGIKTITIEDVEVTKSIEAITFKLEEIEKGGYDHFMLKEIHEQPTTVRDAMRGRIVMDEGSIVLGGLRNHLEKLRNARRIIITACGTSYHAGLIGKYMLEQLAQVPVDIEYASEFRYRNPVVSSDDVMFVISQSGETADTLAAMREGKRKGALALGIVNVVGSTIARESDGGVYVHAGPEIGVASTKAFTSQVTVFALLSIMLGRMKSLSVVDGKEMINGLLQLPGKIQEIIESSEEIIKKIVDEFKTADHFLYLGRGYNYPVALEGALKLKEISYIHAEGYPAAEMKHGPIALIDADMPVVVIAPHDDVYEKVLSNIMEVNARGGRLIAIASVGDTDIASLAEHVIYIPETLPMLVPILSVIPLQLLSYYMATARGADVDQPRNLAKSVTVE